MKEKGCKPFWKHLEDLRMFWENILGLLPKLKQGLEDYGLFDDPLVRKMFGEISEALLQSTRPKKVSVKELNFYLASGMGLYEKLKHVLVREEKEADGLSTLLADLD
jgi:hypothetical protein